MGYTSPVQFWYVVASNTVSNIKLSHFLDFKSGSKKLASISLPSASRPVYFYAASF